MRPSGRCWRTLKVMSLTPVLIKISCPNFSLKKWIVLWLPDFCWKYHKIKITTQVEFEWVLYFVYMQVLRAASIASFLTVCINTPKTIQQATWDNWFRLDYAITIVDMVTFVLFAGEMLAKIHARGLLRVSEQGCKNSGKKAVIFNIFEPGIMQFDEYWGFKFKFWTNNE